MVSTPKRVSIMTLGCRLNFSESGKMANEFRSRGYEIVDFGEAADVVYINTCTVTDGADSDCRNVIRKARKSSPDGIVVVAGCYAQVGAEEIAKIDGVDLILGTSEKFKVFEYLEDDEAQGVHIDRSNDFVIAATTRADFHTRAFLKIQDGCSYGCSYCIIPRARGGSRATGIHELVEEAKRLVADGFKEIVLTGVNVGEYASASGERLESLVARILEVEGLERLRLSSVEPNTVTPDLIAVLKSSPKVMDYFHVPLQSGDPAILQSMRRRYGVDEYARVVLDLRESFPKAGIGADVIVGFPGETQGQFENTLRLIDELPLTHLHVFPFSKRAGTIAARLPGHLTMNEKKERVRILTGLGAQKTLDLQRRMVGEANEVLFEEQKDGMWEGLTTNFLRVRHASNENLSNEVRRLVLTPAHFLLS